MKTFSSPYGAALDPVDYVKRSAWATAQGLTLTPGYPALRKLVGAKCNHTFVRQEWSLLLDHGHAWKRGKHWVLTYCPYICSAYPSELDRLRSFCAPHGLKMTVSADTWYIAPPPADPTILIVIERADEIGGQR